MKNCLIAQSGGPTVAINASLAGVICEGLETKRYNKIYGLKNGITGIFHNEMIDLSDTFVDEVCLDKLKISPAMYLGSCRYKLPNYNEEKEPYQMIFEFFEKYDIADFYYIGGNDSMDTVAKLSNYASIIGSKVKIIGIPKTIDNDLCNIDHTPGFGSAAKYVATSILELAYDTSIYKLKSVTIVEIMGRDAGWLTAASSLARKKEGMAPHLIYLPEVPFGKTQFLEDIRRLLKEKDNIIVAISEGIRDKEGTYVSAETTAVDQFGHSQLSGAAKTLEHLVYEQLGVKVRSIEINTLQRAAAHLSSKTDIEEAYQLGRKAVLAACNGETGVMVTLIRNKGSQYSVAYETTPVEVVANKVRNIPREWINQEGNDVTESMIDYLKPLILGENAVDFEDGLPEYIGIEHLGV